MTTIRDVLQQLEGQGLDITTSTIRKKDNSYNAITINNKELKTKMRINMDDLIIAHSDKSAEQVATIIKGLYVQHLAIDQSINKRFIMENIRIALRKETNDNTIKRSTNFKSIEAYLCIYSKIGSEHNVIIKITQQMLKENHIRKEEAWRQAERNNAANANIISSQELIPEASDELSIYIVTNKTANYGAATILNKDFIVNRLKNDKHKQWRILLPSIHRAVLIPKGNDKNSKTLLEIIKIKESEDTRPEDQLTDKIYTLNTSNDN